MHDLDAPRQLWLSHILCSYRSRFPSRMGIHDRGRPNSPQSSGSWRNAYKLTLKYRKNGAVASSCRFLYRSSVVLSRDSYVHCVISMGPVGCMRFRLSIGHVTHKCTVTHDVLAFSTACGLVLKHILDLVLS